MIALLAALLIQTPPTPSPSMIGLRLDPVTRCVEVWQDGELAQEYEPRDGAIYTELLGILRESRGYQTPPRSATSREIESYGLVSWLIDTLGDEIDAQDHRQQRMTPDRLTPANA
jgi:hypothetical protein